MRSTIQSRTGVKVAVALTWDGARWPARSLPPKARAFLAAKGYTTFSARAMAKLFASGKIGEMRICWVPRLKGGENVLAGFFFAPKGRRVPFRAKKLTSFGDVLGVVYRPAS
jgi:hypothetical protein